MTDLQRPFIPGLDLSELLYRQAVQPILARHFPGLVTSAGLLGFGSEVLGFDTSQSMDHDWGPRLQLFLSESDYPLYREEIERVLRLELPGQIQGYPIDMASREERLPGSGPNPAHHGIQLTTIQQFFRGAVKVDLREELSALNWVLIPQQQLRSVTAGRVFCDDLGELEPARARLRYYPHDVWLYLLAAQWMRISQEEHFMGRCGQVGDDLGSRLIAARLVRDLMNLGFLMERQYAPYIKWFGTAFSRLRCASDLKPLLEATLAAATWQERQKPLAEAYEHAARMHNALGITEPLSVQATPFYERPFLVIWGERFAAAIRQAIHDPQVLALPEHLGGVDQYIDSTDAYNYLNDSMEKIKGAFMSSRVRPADAPYQATSP